MFRGEESRFLYTQPTMHRWSASAAAESGWVPGDVVSEGVVVSVMTSCRCATHSDEIVRPARYRSLNLMLRLNQFMNAEIVSEKTRYTPSTMIIVSTSLPVCIREMPPMVATTSM